MINVINEYLKAVAGVTRTERIRGTVKFAGGTDSFKITDDNIVRGSLSIDEQICAGSFKIGTFNAAQLKITLYDDDAFEHDFSNAKIIIYYELLLSTGKYFIVPLGRFLVDGGLMKRRGNRVFLTAFDYSVNFDVSKPSEDWIFETDIYMALRRLCAASRVSLETSENDIKALPNGDMKISLDNPQIQTNRDCIMWIAALTGCYARINRYGKLEIRKLIYKIDEDDSSVIIPDWTLTGAERVMTEFSDTRTFPKYMTGYSGGKVKQYTSNKETADEQAVEGFYALPQNPITKKLSEEEADEVNNNICYSLSRLIQRGINAEILGNPAIQCGDTVKLSGGVLDIGRKIIGVVTRRTWRYRQGDRLVCQMHDAWVPSDEDEDKDENPEDGENPAEPGEPGGSSNPVKKDNRQAPKTQTEKRIDALNETIVILESNKAGGIEPVYFFGKTQSQE